MAQVGQARCGRQVSASHHGRRRLALRYLHGQVRSGDQRNLGVLEATRFLHDLGRGAARGDVNALCQRQVGCVRGCFHGFCNHRFNRRTGNGDDHDVDTGARLRQIVGGAYGRGQFNPRQVRRVFARVDHVDDHGATSPHHHLVTGVRQDLSERGSPGASA